MGTSEDKHPAAEPRLSLSIGMASTHHASAEELLAAADHALYQSKHAGRDRLTAVTI